MNTFYQKILSVISKLIELVKLNRTNWNELKGRIMTVVMQRPLELIKDTDSSQSSCQYVTFFRVVWDISE